MSNAATFPSPNPAASKTRTSDLGFDENGYPIALPSETSAFLVREHMKKTRPRPIRRNGRPVVVPVTSTFDDFREAVDSVPAQYRLVAVDAHNQPIEGVPEAWVLVEAPSESAHSTNTSATATATDTAHILAAQNTTEALLLETMRANTALARNLIDQLPEIMRSSAELLRAADGAGMPRREPQWFDDDYDDDIEDAEIVNDGAPAWANMLMQLFGAGGLGALGGGLNLSSLLGAASSAAPALPSHRNAAATPASPPAPMTPPPSSTPDGADATPASPSSTAPTATNHHGHLVAIHERLSPSERAYADRCLKSFSLPAVLAWRDTLLSMSVDDAVALIRARAQGQES